jgi:hypothetical protein
MKIEKAMIDRFNGKNERVIAAELSLHLRETGHGSDGH